MAEAKAVKELVERALKNSNVEKSTSISPVSIVQSILSKLSAPREEFIERTADQMDLYKGATGTPDEQFQGQARAAIDFALPDEMSATGGLGKVASKAVQGAQKLKTTGLAQKIASNLKPNLAAQRAQSTFDGVKSADLLDMKKHSNLVGQPVFDSGKHYGKVLNSTGVPAEKIAHKPSAQSQYLKSIGALK